MDAKLVNGEKPSLFGFIFSPQEQFQRVKENPVFAWPLFWFLLLYAIYGAALSYFSLETPEGRESLAMMGSSAKWIMPLISGITMLIAAPIILLFLTGFHRLLMMLFQGEATFRQLFSLNAHLYILMGIGGLIHVIYLSIVGVGSNYEAFPTSLAAIFPAEGTLWVFLSSIEVFAIWKLILSAMGLRVLGDISSGKAWAIALIPFVLSVLINVGVAALMSTINLDMAIS